MTVDRETKKDTKQKKDKGYNKYLEHKYLEQEQDLQHLHQRLKQKKGETC
jgi:hypothetical protein